MKNEVEVIIFDLDNTLVNTDVLREHRETSGRATLTQEQLSNAKIYPQVKPLLIALTKRGVVLAVVTNSPRSYAHEILKFHDIESFFSVIITYNDVLSAGAKPSPKGIELALKKLGKSPKNAIYIGDDDKDFVASYTAGVKPVAPAWATRNSFKVIPSALLCTSALMDDVDCFDSINLIADICASHNKFLHSRRWLYFMPMKVNGEVGAIRKNKIDIICLGKYFSQTGELTAKLHDAHPLSKEIVKKESDPSYIIPDYLIQLVKHCIHRVSLYFFDNNNAFDIVTVIPAKKDKNPRLENMLNAISSGEYSGTSYVSDLFYFEQGSVSLKTLGPKENRDEEISSNFKFNSKYSEFVRGKKILVIDDIVTTGSTFQGAFNLLSEYVPEKILGLCLAKTVSIYSESKLCSECGRVMVIRNNKTDGIHFWGCSGYYETEQCTHAEGFKIKDCPKCNKPMIKKLNRKKGTYFLSCVGYHDNSCKHTEDAF